MKLVDLAEYHIKGINYYWVRKDNFNLSYDELRSAGVTANDAQVDERLVPKLQAANAAFRPYGYEIIVKDGYRSPDLYELVRQKRYINDGQETTDRTLNAVTKPHATGLVVDVSLVKLSDGQEVEIWDKADWPEGVFIDYYRHHTHPRAAEYQQLQDLLAEVMLGLGFKFGSKREFWHFEYLDLAE
jgi:D-alanyl-D-alanine dipeptidase